MTATRLAIGIGGINIEVEGEEEFAREVFDFFKEKLAERVSATTLTSAPAAKAVPVAAVPVAEEAGYPSLREFYQEKKPRTHMECVTVFAYYKSEYESISEVGEDDLAPMFDDVRAERPSHIKDALNNARHHRGWFQRGSPTGVYRISNAGKNLVEHDLPHQPSGR